MTDKEKLAEALEGLRLIKDSTWSSMAVLKCFAATRYERLTAPRMKSVNLVRWITVYPDGNTGGGLYCTKCEAERDHTTKGVEFRKINILVSRPIEEKEDVWEDRVVQLNMYGNGGNIPFPYEWVGKTVEVRLKETAPVEETKAWRGHD